MRLNLWTWERPQLTTTLKDAEGRLSAHGLALQDPEKADKLKNSVTRGSKKHGAYIIIMGLRRPQIPSKTDRR